MPHLRARTLRSAAFRAESRIGISLTHGATRPVTLVGRRVSVTDERKQSLLTLLSAVESATTAELAYVLEVSSNRAWVLLDLLEAEGRVERTGKGRNLRWTLP